MNGIVPKNHKGSWEMWTPAHLPIGAVHVTLPGAASIALKLALDFSNALTGFEMKAGRAVPVIEGIVIAAHLEALIVDAQEEFAAMKAEEERARRDRKTVANWRLLIKVMPSPKTQTRKTRPET